MTDSIPQKRCSQCQQEFPATLEYFCVRRKSKDGLAYWCRKCNQICSHQRYIPRPQKETDIPEGQKRCIRCNTIFPATMDFFYADKTMKYGVGSYCRSCAYIRKGSGTYHPRTRINPIQPPLPFAKYCYSCQTAKDIDDFPIRDNGKRRAQCSICLNARVRRNYVSNINHYRLTGAEKSIRRRNRLNAKTINYKHILEKEGTFCYICEKAIIKGQEIHFDHVIPLARGGIHCESNIHPTHKACNLRKHDKLLEEMTPYQRRGV